MASKKGGLGAQKVSSKSFTELEKKAQAADKLREKEEGTTTGKNIQSEESMCVFLLLLSVLYLMFSFHLFVVSACLFFAFLFAAILPLCFVIFKLTCLALCRSVPSLRLACIDLEKQRKMEEQKLKGLEGKKREQAERLGMGLGVRRYDDEETSTSHPPANLCH